MCNKSFLGQAMAKLVIRIVFLYNTHSNLSVIFHQSVSAVVCLHDPFHKFLFIY